MSDTPSLPTPVEVVLHEERLQLGTGRVVTERVVLRRVVTEQVRQMEVLVRREELQVQRLPVQGGAATAVPAAAAPPTVVVLSEEVPVLTMRTRPYERVTVYVDTVDGTHEVTETLHREQVDVQVDGAHPRPLTGSADRCCGLKEPCDGAEDLLVQLGRRPPVTPDRRAGFTLVELLVVMLILGVLAGIAIPVFSSQRHKAWDAAATSSMSTAYLAMLSAWETSDPSAFSGNQAEMTALEPAVTWLASYGVDTSNPPVGAVAFEWASGGSHNTTVMGIRSRSGRCFYLRAVEDGSLSPSGVGYFSQPGPCADPWDRTSQMTRPAW